MSTWISESHLPWYSALALKILKCGPVPRHVAFIMDGNRRFARKNCVDKIEGHSKGFDKLSDVLQWCLDLGVKEVTVYAFSIENFKRSTEEVDSIMNLARDKFRRILEEKEKLVKYGLRIKIIGNKTYLPPDLQRLAAEAELSTVNHNNVVLNVAFSYTGQDEIANAVDTAFQGLKIGQLQENDISVGLLSRLLYTQDVDFPEIIIRTSGETRLSDFLLWQCSCSYLHFAGVLWPEFSFWDFIWAVFKYQRVAHTLADIKKRCLTSDVTGNASLFAKSVEVSRRQLLSDMVRGVLSEA